METPASPTSFPAFTAFTIGKVTGVHGLGGNLKVWSFADSIDTFRPGRTVLLQSKEDPGTLYSILKVSPHKKGFMLVLEGVETRELAESLVGKDILIDREQLPEPEEDSWYWEDLLGLKVIDRHRGFIGTVTRIFPTGANDVLVVMDNEQETLVPMNQHFVASVDIGKGRIETTLPEDY